MPHIHMYDMVHSHTWLACVTLCSYVFCVPGWVFVLWIWLCVSFVCLVVWLCCVPSHSVTTRMCKPVFLFVTRCYVWHDVCVTWRMCDVTYVWHDVCVTWRTCDMTYVWHDVCVTWRILLYDMPNSNIFDMKYSNNNMCHVKYSDVLNILPIRHTYSILLHDVPNFSMRDKKYSNTIIFVCVT